MEKSDFKLLYDKDQISSVVKRLAQEITEDYKDESVVLISPLKGSFIFIADLIRELKVPSALGYYIVKTHIIRGNKKIVVNNVCDIEIKNRNVLIIEDIIDSGRTIRALIQHMNRRVPKEIKICTLFDKYSCREFDVKADYVGFLVQDNPFLVGYGLDYEEQYRNFPEVFELKTKR